MLRRQQDYAMLIVGFSGGVDSRVLLDLCRRYSEGGGMKLGAAHLNHQLRRESATTDSVFCEKICADAGIPYHTQSLKVMELSRRQRIGIEEAGRVARHQFFAELSREYGEAVILLGHHADDQVETIVMNMQRGASLRGIAGIRQSTVIRTSSSQEFTIWRPLLTTRKSAITAYAKQHNLSWREDKSNTDISFTRNLVRGRVLPMLEQALPDIREMLVKLGEEMSIAETALSKCGNKLAAAASAEAGNGILVKLSPLLAAERTVLPYALRHLLEAQAGSGMLASTHYTKMVEMIESGRTGATLCLPGNIRVTKEADSLYIHRDEELPSESEWVLPEPPFDLVGMGLRICAEIVKTKGSLPATDRSNPEVEWLDAAAVRYPLVVRSRRSGDRMRPLGAPGSAKVKDILINRKVPQRLKQTTRVLSDYAGILWLIPHCIAQRARVTSNSREAIRISVAWENDE